jgi:Tol biopolymer transport system component
MDWSSDGKTIVFGRRVGAAAPAMNIWYVASSDNAKPVPYLESQFQKGQAQLSPDGRWLAYATNESGTAQVVVQSFPDPKTAKIVVTRNGGTEPRWRRDGRELFYLAPDGKLMAVPIKSGDTFEAGTEAALFQTPLSAGNVWNSFATTSQPTANGSSSFLRSTPTPRPRALPSQRRSPPL